MLIVKNLRPSQPLRDYRVDKTFLAGARGDKRTRHNFLFDHHAMILIHA